MADTKDQYEKQHLENLIKLEQQLSRSFESSIHHISHEYSQITFEGQVFKLKDYPHLLQTVQKEIAGLRNIVYTAALNAIKLSWKLSAEKNDVLVDERLGGKTASARAKKILYDPNQEALKVFIKRHDQGLNLSDRVWNSFDGYKTEMEAALGVGIGTGTPAVQLAKDLKKYLKNPDKLFRKVADAEGNLKLSQAAKNYHPGQGVYRSSFQNALRVTASETNMAYRTADWERWQRLDFVVGLEVHLSKSHPEYDICDPLAGKYPKTFYFRGWHPKCLCYQTAIQMTDKEYRLAEKILLKTGKLPDVSSVNQVTDLPDDFIKYYEDNQERIAGWKNKPYWLKDNQDLIQQALARKAAPKAADRVGIAFAPFRSKNVNSLGEDITIRNAKEYKLYRQTVIAAAKGLGINISETRNTWGGYIDSETKIPVQEVSNIISVDAKDGLADLLAAIIGKAAPEMQDSVLVGEHNINGEGSEIIIRTGSFDNARKAIGSLKENNIDYFTIDKDNGDIILLDTDDSNTENIINFIGDLQKNKIYEGSEISKTNARFIGKEDYDRIIQKGRSEARTENGFDIDVFIEETRKKYQEIDIDNIMDLAK